MRSLVVCIVLLSTPVWAQETVDIDTVEVHGDREASEAAPEAARALDDPAFVTVIVLDEEHQESTSVGEVLAESVGASVRSLGGLGAFTSVSLRGAPSSQTEILVDGVPLSRLASSSMDLGLFDLATFDGVEVHRGAVPVELGGAALGGAVNFTTAIGPRPGLADTQLTLAGGSFGARQARVVRRDDFADVGTTLALGYAGARGDFEYFDDAATQNNTSDDVERDRQNNDYDQLDGVARARFHADGTTIEGGARLSWKDQGVPGLGTQSVEDARLSTWRGVLDGRWQRVGALARDDLDLGASGYLVVEEQRFADPGGEISLAQDTSGLTLGSSLGLRAGLAVSDTQLVGVALEPRFEWFQATDEASGMVADSGLRSGGGLALSDTLSFFADRLLVVPALRLDWLYTRPDVRMAPGDDAVAERHDLEPSPRVSARYTVIDGLAVKGSTGRYFRAPTLAEVFGSRGSQRGNPALRSETGLSADLGVVYAPATALAFVDRLFVEAALFGSDTQDLIAWAAKADRTVQAVNLDDAVLGGVELAAAARFFSHLVLSGNYTFFASRVDSKQLAADGGAMPGRPRHELYLRAEGDLRIAGWRIAAHTDLSYDDGNFIDPANRQPMPSRYFLGAGLRLDTPYHLVFALTCRNLLDERKQDVVLGPNRFPRAVSDVNGYPLPGRALMFSATAGF